MTQFYDLKEDNEFLYDRKRRTLFSENWEIIDL